MKEFKYFIQIKEFKNEKNSNEAFKFHEILNFLKF